MNRERERWWVFIEYHFLCAHFIFFFHLSESNQNDFHILWTRKVRIHVFDIEKYEILFMSIIICWFHFIFFINYSPVLVHNVRDAFHFQYNCPDESIFYSINFEMSHEILFGRTIQVYMWTCGTIVNVSQKKQSTENFKEFFPLKAYHVSGCKSKFTKHIQQTGGTFRCDSLPLVAEAYFRSEHLLSMTVEEVNREKRKQKSSTLFQSTAHT